MPTVSDYSSIAEIGFGVNLATSYIAMFVNPALARAEKEVANFRWWIENPDRLKQTGGGRLNVEDFEDALSEWLHALEGMRRAIERHRRWPTGAAIVGAVLTFLVLLFPEAAMGSLRLLALVAISMGPVIGGSIYLWSMTRSERLAERKACKAANNLFVVTS